MDASAASLSIFIHIFLSICKFYGRVYRWTELITAGDVRITFHSLAWLFQKQKLCWLFKSRTDAESLLFINTSHAVQTLFDCELVRVWLKFYDIEGVGNQRRKHKTGAFTRRGSAGRENKTQTALCEAVTQNLTADAFM